MGENRIRKILNRKGLEGIIFFSPENIRYLTGFSGSEAYLLAATDENLLMVDSRYLTQAQDETKECRVTLLERRLTGLAGQISSLGFKRLGFEAHGISVALFEQLQEEMEGVALIPLKEDLERLRGFKTKEEITLIKKAIDIAEGAWQKALDGAREGMKEHEVALELEYRMKIGGSEGAAFECIVASGPRSALPHARPTPRPLEAGDLLLFDFGARYKGYHSDESLTVVVGRVTAEQKRIYSIVKDAHDRAIEKVRPGAKLSEIDAKARDYIIRTGHGEHFGHGTGHGVGLAVHEWPSVGKDSQEVAEEGMIFTIEPGIYIPGWGGIRIEDMVLVDHDGCEVLTTISKNLMILS